MVVVSLLDGSIAPYASGFELPRGLSVNGNQSLLVTDSGDDALKGVDLSTIVVSTISGTHFGTGPIFVNPRDVTIDLVNQRAFVVDFTSGVFSIDGTPKKSDSRTLCY